MRRIAWILYLRTSTLSGWDKAFDEDMKPFKIPENRGRASKVTPELVRRVVEKARELKDRKKRIRLKKFTAELEKDGLILSSKTVSEILIANGLREASTRKRRPRFYQGLRQRIPNGLLSLDGSEFTVWCDGIPITLNLELGVDVGTFTHTAFSIGNTETSAGVLDVLHIHIDKWGCPIGIVSDHGSANMSADVAAFIDTLGIEFVPAGPGNPKGNGTLEGAFSQMKRIIGTIRLDTSSTEALCKCVLEAIVSVYVKMRNILPLRGKNDSPVENFTKPVSKDQIDFERQRLKKHKENKNRGSDDQSKIDLIRFLIKNKNIPCDPDARKRAEKSIIGYTTKAITSAEAAFIKSVNRKHGRLNLPYFFGILIKIQKKQDDEIYKEYCRQKYDHKQMLKHERTIKEIENERDKPPSIDHTLDMLEKGLYSKNEFLRRVCLKTFGRYINRSVKGKTYLEPLRKKFMDAIGKIKHLSIEQKDEMLEYFQNFLINKFGQDCVT